MNPLTNVRNIQKLNERELELGVIGKKSWHDEYKDSAWVFIGGLPYDLTEGDIICIFSQYGEIVNINLVRDKSTGKSKGFAFLCYEDQRSTVLAVDNLNSIKVLGRVIRVDHVSDYKMPKERGDEDEVTLQLRAEGCAPKVPLSQLMEEPPTIRPPASAVKPKKAKKDKKKKKKKKKMKVTVKVEQKSESDDSSSSSSSDGSDDEDSKDKVTKKRKHKSAGAAIQPDKVKKEKMDKGYDRALHGHRESSRNSNEDRKPTDSELESWQRRHAGHRGEYSNGGRHRGESSDGGRHRGESSDGGRHKDDDWERKRRSGMNGSEHDRHREVGRGDREERRHDRSEDRHRDRHRDGHRDRSRDSEHDRRDQHRDGHDRRR